MKIEERYWVHFKTSSVIRKELLLLSFNDEVLSGKIPVEVQYDSAIKQPEGQGCEESYRYVFNIGSLRDD